MEETQSIPRIPCLENLNRCKALCCGIVAFTPEEWGKYAPQATVKPTKVMRVEGYMIPITEDALCCFLDRQKRQCVIYQTRPQLCLMYGYTRDLECPWYNASGEKRRRAERRELVRKINTRIEINLKKLLKMT
jgi:Fe-S-cluster containining protein